MLTVNSAPAIGLKCIGFGLAALVWASAAQAQSNAVLLDCGTGQSTASVTIGTDASWSRSSDGGSTWAPAAITFDVNGSWSTALTGSSWIGNGAGGQPASAQQFLRTLQLGSGVDTSVPLTVSSSFLVDDSLTGLTIGGLSTGISGGTYTGVPTNASGTVSLPSAGDYPLVALVNNSGGGYGVAMSLTITGTCRATPVAAVPADAPWALGTLTGLIALLATLAARRRRA